MMINVRGESMNHVLNNTVTKEGAIVDFTSQMSIVNCGCCGGVYALSKRYIQMKRVNGGYWNCPYCKNSWGYSKENSEVEQLKNRIDKQTKAATYQREQKEHALQQRDASIRSNSALKGVVTKKKKQLDRVKNGVCPCCNRHFKNLERHMKSQHPEGDSE
jgi:hypothetical protein